MSMGLDEAIGGVGVDVNAYQDGRAFAAAVIAKKLEVMRKWGEECEADIGELEAAYFLQGYMYVTPPPKYEDRFSAYWQKHARTVQKPVEADDDECATIVIESRTLGRSQTVTRKKMEPLFDLLQRVRAAVVEVSGYHEQDKEISIHEGVVGCEWDSRCDGAAEAIVVKMEGMGRDILLACKRHYAEARCQEDFLCGRESVYPKPEEAEVKPEHQYGTVTISYLLGGREGRVKRKEDEPQPEFLRRVAAEIRDVVGYCRPVPAITRAGDDDPSHPTCDNCHHPLSEGISVDELQRYADALCGDAIRRAVVYPEYKPHMQHVAQFTAKDEGSSEDELGYAYGPNSDVALLRAFIDMIRRYGIRPEDGTLVKRDEKLGGGD